MALKGDLSSFALPDVLRLLAGTAKTGRLGVSGAQGSGEVWLLDGDLVGGSVDTSAHAKQATEVVFELLRFETGSFLFDDGEEQAEPGEPSSVDEAISVAEALLFEWAEVEAVVPSMNSWVSLSPELDGNEVTISSPQWRVLAAVGAGTTVRTLGNHFQITDLKVSRRVKGLVEAGLVELGEPVDGHRDDLTSEAGSGFHSGYTGADYLGSDLAMLSAEDGPVVMQSHDDAMLPEPLPGEGTRFVGELDGLGTVDGRSFESIESEAALADAARYAEPVEEPVVEEMNWFLSEIAEPTDAYADVVADEFPDVIAPADEFPEDELASIWAAEPANSDDAAIEATETEAAAEAPVKAEERGSLLKFLSSVKP